MLFSLNRITASILLICGFVILTMAGSSARQAQSSPQSVLVTNSTSQAVPVKPASGSAFATTITNTPNVHAYITNAATTPVNVTDATQGKNGHTVFFSGTVSPGATNAIAQTSGPPQGKRFVIENAQVELDSLSAETIGAGFLLIDGTQGTQMLLGLAPQVQTAYSLTVSEADLRGPLFLDTGETLQVNVYRVGGTGQETFNVTLTGYLVNYP